MSSSLDAEALSRMIGESITLLRRFFLWLLDSCVADQYDLIAGPRGVGTQIDVFVAILKQKPQQRPRNVPISWEICDLVYIALRVMVHEPQVMRSYSQVV